MKLDENRCAHDAEFDRQAKLLYSLIVAGKSANFADKAIKSFLEIVGVATGSYDKKNGKVNLGYITKLPFDMLRDLDHESIFTMLHCARTGNYNKLTRAIVALLDAKFDLSTVTPAQLETIHGIGPKSSRFFIMWCRPNENYAALDVHILRWMAGLGYTVPKQTPQNKKTYACIEKLFIGEAKKRNLTPRQLDMQIWEAGAGRKQEKAI